MCVFNETCGTGLALEHNGDLYSCDHFVEPNYLLGNIQRQPPASSWSPRPNNSNSARTSATRCHSYCRECDVRFACHGECPKNRFIETPDGEPGLNYLCAGFKLFFQHVDFPMKLMAGLIRRGREAQEVMSDSGSGLRECQIATIPVRAAVGASSSSAMASPGSGQVENHCPAPQSRSEVVNKPIKHWQRRLPVNHDRLPAAHFEFANRTEHPFSSKENLAWQTKNQTSSFCGAMTSAGGTSATTAGGRWATGRPTSTASATKASPSPISTASRAAPPVGRPSSPARTRSAPG